MEMTNGFNEIVIDEMNDINGGSITLGAAIILAAKVIGGCAAVGFAGGCAYEIVLGK